MSTAPLTEVRDKISEILDDIQATGNEWVITRHGRPVAVILALDEYESLLETVNILSDAETLDALAEAEGDVAEGQTRELPAR